MKADRIDATAALVFLASAALTVVECSSMDAMPGMDMPGGWVMSMTWMRMPGQGVFAHAAMFLGMWSVMMLAMMMPAFWPMLAVYRRSLPARQAGTLGPWMACGYFAVWIISGAALLPPGLAVAQWVMRDSEVSRAVPAAGALVVVLAGLLQFSGWKARRLANCRAIPRESAPTRLGAWRHGLSLGRRCVYCCANLTAVLLVMGVMDLRAMALVTMAISAERLMPERRWVARAVGAGLMMAGGMMWLTGSP